MKRKSPTLVTLMVAALFYWGTSKAFILTEDVGCNINSGMAAEQTKGAANGPGSSSFNRDCLPYILVKNCVEITIEEEQPGIEKTFIYEWDFGDGNKGLGKEIKHCYERPGVYEVSMSLKDETTGMVLEQEWFGEVEITADIKPEITGPSRITVGAPATYGYDLDLPEGYEVQRSLWNVDGRETEGPSVETVFDQVGTYSIDLEVELLKASEKVSLCVSAKIIVEDFNVDGSIVSETFRKAVPHGFVTGRFLDDALRLGLLNFTKGAWQEVVLGEKKHSIPVEGGTSYRVILWKGNQFTEFMGLETDGLSDSDAFKKLGALVEKIRPGEVLYLPSVYFELDDDSNVDASALAGHMSLLKSQPWLRIDLGVHTHHQGAVRKGTALADKRADLIESVLLSNGVGPEIIRKHSPINNLALLNNCAGIVNCLGTDERLSRRADFKVAAVDYERHLVQ